MRTTATRTLRLAVAAALLSCLLGQGATAVAVPSTPEIEAKRAEAEAARARLQDFADQAELAREELIEAAGKLERTRAEVVKTRQRLEDARRAKADAQDALADRVSGIYRNGGVQLVEVLLGTASFTEFLSRVEWLRRIGLSDAALVANVKAAVLEVETAQHALERREAEQVTLRRQAEIKAHDVERALTRQQAFVTDLDEDVARLVEQEEERLRREAEERARQAAEDAARRAAQAAARRGSGASSGPPAPSREALPNHRVFDPSLLGAGNPQAVVVGMRYLGVPYLWGGSTPSGFDCSGLTQYVYRELGVEIPRNSRAQFRVGAFIPPDRLDLLLPGDLVFFGRDGDPDRIHHVGIFVGGEDYLHAPSTGRPVQVESLLSRIERRGDYVGATRP